jgi:hypothetical protein
MVALKLIHDQELGKELENELSIFRIKWFKEIMDKMV